MMCPRCQTESPQGAKFCLECGAPLKARCESCGAPLLAAAKFCRECGYPVAGAPGGGPRFGSPGAYTPRHLAEKILTSRGSLEGERKQVTVLIADLKDSLELIADRDPEEARKLLDPVLEHMMAAVHRYEGTVNHVMGDGIMALFGAPLAHEDHAVRACYAALKMQEAVKRYAEELFRAHGVLVQIRVGLNSGEVVVRSIGSDLHMDYLAVGQTTYLAARMEQLAAPGTVLLAPMTLQLAEGYVHVTSRGPVAVRGLPEPIEVYEVVGPGAVRSRRHAAAARGLTRFVGRGGEIDQLRRALELIARTQGNPLFLEETAQALVETKALVGERGAYRLAHDATAVQVPTTVQAILAARIDRLSPEDKRLLQAASVIGTDVPFALLLAVAELGEEDLRRALGHLQAAEFLYEARLFPDLEYTFKHALTHEVAYGGLLPERRRDLHARLVVAIETLHRDRLGEQVERLAHHALRGEVWQKAVPYLRQAGLKAAGRSALPEAREWFEQALGVLATLPESPSTLEQGFDIRLELRPLLGQLGEYRRVMERLREAEAIAEALDDDRRRGRVCAVMTNALSQLGELDEALQLGTRALTAAGRGGDLGLRLLTTTYLEQVHYFRGEYERAVELATENLTVLPADSAHESFGAAMPIAIYDRYLLVRSLAQLGRFAQAARYEAEALRPAELTRHAYTVGMAHLAASWLHLFEGDWARARPLIEQGVAAYRAGNIVLNLPHAVASSAWALAQAGDLDLALSRFQEGEQLLEREGARGIVGIHGEGCHVLGRAALLLGRLAEVRRLGERALADSPAHPGFAAHAWHLLGDVSAHPDRFDAEEAESHHRKALALTEARAMRPLVAHCHSPTATSASAGSTGAPARPSGLGKA